MTIVIDIDDDLYTRLFDAGENYVMDMRRVCVAVRKGKVIPNHGRLIDADETLKAMDSCDKFAYSRHDMFKLTKESEKDYISHVYYSDMVRVVNNASTIIEADTKSEE